MKALIKLLRDAYANHEADRKYWRWIKNFRREMHQARLPFDLTRAIQYYVSSLTPLDAVSKERDHIAKGDFERRKLRSKRTA